MIHTIAMLATTLSFAFVEAIASWVVIGIINFDRNNKRARLHGELPEEEYVDVEYEHPWRAFAILYAVWVVIMTLLVGWVI